MKIRCLVLEDESRIQDFLEELLDLRGYEVSFYKSPIICPLYHNHDSCCNRKERCRDIGIFDNHMPGMKGIDFFELQLKKGCKAIKGNTAIMSGNFSEEDIKKAETLGCKVFKKPFSLKELERWLDECERRINQEQNSSQ